MQPAVAAHKRVSEPDETDRLLQALGPVRERWLAEKRRREAREYRESLELLKAVRLAPSLGLCEALLRGERVPRSWLDQDWVRAYGR